MQYEFVASTKANYTVTMKILQGHTNELKATFQINADCTTIMQGRILRMLLNISQKWFWEVFFVSLIFIDFFLLQKKIKIFRSSEKRCEIVNTLGRTFNILRFNNILKEFKYLSIQNLCTVYIDILNQSELKSENALKVSSSHISCNQFWNISISDFKAFYHSITKRNFFVAWNGF